MTEYHAISIDLWMPKIAKTFFDTLYGAGIDSLCDGTYKDKNEKSVAAQEAFKKGYWKSPIDERIKVLSSMVSVIDGGREDEQ